MEIRGQTYSEFGFLIGDFNGDGKDDIFNGNGAQWRILAGGTTTWTVLRNHPLTTDHLNVGYFNEADLDGNPDKIADIFRKKIEDWKVWYGGKGGAQILKTTNSVDDLLFGDFNGDGRTDVFRIRERGH